jgi:hypothetical protein
MLLAVPLGSAHRFVRMGVFFSQAAVVTFGGAYAVLTYAAQRVVEVCNGQVDAPPGGEAVEQMKQRHGVATA